MLKINSGYHKRPYYLPLRGETLGLYRCILSIKCSTCQYILKIIIKSLHFILVPFIFFNLMYEIRDNLDKL